MVLSPAIEILEACQIHPDVDSKIESTLQDSIALSYFDLQYLQFPPTERLLFYEVRPPVFADAILSNLKRSLSLTLGYFRPIAGKLVWPSDSNEPFIQIDEDDSIPLTIAESNVDLDFFCSDTPRRATAYRPLIPDLQSSDRESGLMALQITIFPNHGFCIGVTYHHVAHDGKGLSLFLKSWANICKNRCTDSLPPELTPVYDRALIDDQYNIKELLLNNVSAYKNTSLKLREIDYEGYYRGQFTLSSSAIDGLREFVTQRQGYPCKMSTFVLACAHLWVCLVKTHKLFDKRVYFVCAADLRSRLQFPVPATYFGNCVFPCIASAAGNDLMGEDGLILAMEAISEALKGLGVDPVPGDVKKLSLRPDLFQEMRVLSLAGSPQLRLYDTDFGWGRPRKVKVVSISRNGEISLAESHDGSRGMEIGLMMTEEKLGVFSSLFADGIK
ncbi:unnamed protein product [Bemisia tabaci]|uniref:Uncharacterized protein n=1 Tax=Bemisia tabaci TaxID=7038 RepID=A0A9P0F7C1_BEMTA|nr:unnamed protein product [Bemisia tabaci]